MRLLVGGLCAAAVLGSSWDARAGVINCGPTELRILSVASVRNDKTSNTFGNLPQAAITFTQGGSKATCVVVQFSAVGQSGVDRLEIRAVLDGTVIATPPTVECASATSPAAYSYSFVFASVTPGKHTVQMQYASLDNGTVTVKDRVTIMQFTK